MVEILVVALVLAFAGLCMWLAVQVFVAILPYLVVGLVGWSGVTGRPSAGGSAMIPSANSWRG